MTTIEEATKLLKMSEQAIWLKGLEKEQKEAIDMAIKSLEAWEKVKEEIKYHADNIRYTDAYRDGFEVSLKIIDKHLSEVSE